MTNLMIPLIRTARQTQGRAARLTVACRALALPARRAPVATKTATSIVAAMLGDALAQHVARSKAGRDWR